MPLVRVFNIQNVLWVVYLLHIKLDGYIKISLIFYLIRYICGT